MRDTLPSFEDSAGNDTQTRGGDTGETGDSDSSTATADGQAAGSSGHSPTGDTGQGPGTRADNGLEGIGSDGPLTTAEQVAILDRQLEQSTGEFDTMILEEQQRQRSRERQRTPSTPQDTGTTGGSSRGDTNPYYRDDVAMEDGSAGGGGGLGGAGGPAPGDPAIHKAPPDIPAGDDDDVVARQLREAAMREPDPAIRERLWNEYRKYKGIEIPDDDPNENPDENLDDAP